MNTIKAKIVSEGDESVGLFPKVVREVRRALVDLFSCLWADLPTTVTFIGEGFDFDAAEQADKEAVDGAEYLLCPLSNEQPCYRSDCAWWVEGEGLIGRCAISSIAHQRIIADQILGQDLVVDEGSDFDAAAQAYIGVIKDAAQRDQKLNRLAGEFSTGTLTNPRPQDQRFDFLDEAIEAAVKGSMDDFVWGVWNDDSGELMAIVYQGLVYIE
jgi:hypothetical protein